MLYSRAGFTAMAVLEGRVQGVVVQASKQRSGSPTTAKRVSLREANFELKGSGPATREFFFTPRNPGQHDVEFFLAKAFNPTQVAKTYKLNVLVKG